VNKETELMRLSGDDTNRTFEKQPFVTIAKTRFIFQWIPVSMEKNNLFHTKPGYRNTAYLDETENLSKLKTE